MTESHFRPSGEGNAQFPSLMLSQAWSALPIPAPAPPSVGENSSAGKTHAVTGKCKWPEQAGLGGRRQGREWCGPGSTSQLIWASLGPPSHWPQAKPSWLSHQLSRYHPLLASGCGDHFLPKHAQELGHGQELGHRQWQEVREGRKALFLYPLTLHCKAVLFPWINACPCCKTNSLPICSPTDGLLLFFKAPNISLVRKKWI